MTNTYAVDDGTAARPASVGVYVELSKPGITRMVVVAAAVGFTMASLHHGGTLRDLIVPFLICMLGTAVSSAGANGLNQWVERRLDLLMERTKGRPIPSGRLTSRAALVFSLSCAVLGPLLLSIISPLASAAAMATVLLYVLVYTPMKTRSSMATLVGAVPGALPIAIGWLAASPSGWSDLARWPMWSVFLVLLVWQMPHFLAIASMYREDYRRGGFHPIPADTPDPVLAWVIFAWAVALVAASVAPVTAMPDQVGLIYLVVALASAALFIMPTIAMIKRPLDNTAKRVFLASIVYLPLVLISLVVDAAVGWSPA